jgi:hypothetical protein
LLDSEPQAPFTQADPPRAQIKGESVLYLIFLQVYNLCLIDTTSNESTDDSGGPSAAEAETEARVLVSSEFSFASFHLFYISCVSFQTRLQRSLQRFHKASLWVKNLHCLISLVSLFLSR